MLYRGYGLFLDFGSLVDFLERATSFPLAHHPHDTTFIERPAIIDGKALPKMGKSSLFFFEGTSNAEEKPN